MLSPTCDANLRLRDLRDRARLYPAPAEFSVYSVTVDDQPDMLVGFCSDRRAAAIAADFLTSQHAVPGETFVAR